MFAARVNVTPRHRAGQSVPSRNVALRVQKEDNNPGDIKGLERKAKQAQARVEAANSDKTFAEAGGEDAIDVKKQAYYVEELLTDEQAKDAESKDNGPSILDKAADALKGN